MSYFKKTILHTANRFTTFKTINFLNQLSLHQSLSSTQIKLQQFNKLKKLITHAYNTSDFYRNKFIENKIKPEDIKNLEDFKKIPILEKQDLSLLISTLSQKNKKLSLYSSKTTSKNKSAISMNFQEASAKYALYLQHLTNCGWDFDTQIIQFLPSIYKTKIIDYQNGFWQILSTFIQNKIAHNFITNRKIIFYDSLDPKQISKTLIRYKQQSVANKQTIIIGRSEFLAILNYLHRHKQTNFFKIKSIINIGNILPNQLSHQLNNTFNCPVYNIYGSSEVSYVACGQNNKLALNEETHLCEIEPINKSTYGNIIVTDLINYSMPIIRYRIGDLGQLLETTGKNYLSLGGRTQNSIKNQNGDLIPETKIINEIFKEKTILFFKFVKTNKKNFTLQIISKQNKTINELDLLKRLENLTNKTIKLLYFRNIPHNNINKYTFIQNKSKNEINTKT